MDSDNDGRSTDALRESERRYRDLVDNAHDIIYGHDLNGNVNSWNRAGQQILGYSDDEVRQMNIAQIVTPEQLAVARP